MGSSARPPPPPRPPAAAAASFSCLRAAAAQPTGMARVSPSVGKLTSALPSSRAAASLFTQRDAADTADARRQPTDANRRRMRNVGLANRARAQPIGRLCYPPKPWGILQSCGASVAAAAAAAQLRINPALAEGCRVEHGKTGF